MAGPEEIRPPGGKHGWRMERGSSIRDEVCENTVYEGKDKENGAESTTLLLVAESMCKIRSNLLYFERCVT